MVESKTEEYQVISDSFVAECVVSGIVTGNQDIVVLVLSDDDRWLERIHKYVCHKIRNFENHIHDKDESIGDRDHFKVTKQSIALMGHPWRQALFLPLSDEPERYAGFFGRLIVIWRGDMPDTTLNVLKGAFHPENAYMQIRDQI